MPLLTLEDIFLSFSDKPLLDNVAAVIHKGDKIALIGRNGAGKSTLLRLIAGIIKPDLGEITKKNDISISYLEQDLIIDDKQNLFSIVAQGLAAKGKLISDYQLALANDNFEKTAILQDEIDNTNSWHYINAINKIIMQFDLDPNQHSSNLSGGMKKRLMLAKSLIAEPDVLLLDEPTNHLDIKSILYLEKLLIELNTTLVFISHDRSFVKNIANKIFDLDRAKIKVFYCDYEKYLIRKDELLNAEQLAQKRFDKKLSQEETWIRQGVKARRTRNEGRVKALKKMRKEYLNSRAVSGNAKFHEIKPEYSSKIVFEVNNISYEINNLKLINNFSTLILRGDKIGIIGGNGVGKTTFIKVLLGDIQPTSGDINRAQNIKLAYFDQMREIENLNITAMDYVSGGRDKIDINGRSTHIIGYLRNFLFTSKQARAPISYLSGGEKNRLILAKILSQNANLLVLDEPSNDLDVETLELLEDMLSNYKGTLIVISHDRAFLNNIVSSTIVFETIGDIKQYAGGYDDYLIQRKATNTTKQDKNNQIKNETKVDRNVTNINKRKIANIEKEIIKIENKINSLQAKISQDNFYKNTDAIVKETLGQLQNLEDNLNLLYKQWEDLE